MKFTLSSVGHVTITDELRIKRWKHAWKDLILICDGIEILASKKVLMAEFPYFHAMFSWNFRESRLKRIIIHGVDPTALEALVSYSHGGKITFTEETVQLLIQAADMFGMTDVLNAASDFLSHLLHPSNAIGILTFANHYNCSQLVTEAELFLGIHFLEVTQDDEYKALTPDQMKKLQSIRRSSALSQVVLNLTTATNASKFSVFSFLERSWTNLPPIPVRRSGAKLVAFGGVIYAFGGNIGEPTSSVEVYHLLEQEWSAFRAPSMGVPRAYFTANIKAEGRVGGQIYVIGGITTGKETLNSAERYDVILGRWQKISPMDTARAFHGCGLLNNAIYVVGGQNIYGKTLASVERYKDGIWRNVANLNEKRAGVSVGVVGDKILAVGGWNGFKLLSSVEIYNPEENVWKFTTPMMKPRRNAGVVVNQNRLIVIGGDPRDYHTIECYNPDTERWSFMPTHIPHQMKSVSSIVIDHNRLPAWSS